MLDYQSPARAFEDTPAGFEYASERSARDAARFDRSAAIRAEQARRHRTALYALYVVLAAIFIGAITHRGIHNWKEARAENVQQ